MILDQYGNVISTVQYDDMTDTTYVRVSQDCEPIIEHNKRLKSLNDGYSPSREMKRMASIPLALFQRWLQDDGLTWNDYWNRMDRKERSRYRARKLMSSDWRHLRTS